MRRYALSLSLLVSVPFLGGCFFGGGGHDKTWEDSRYATLMDTAHSVFQLGHIKQAEQQYGAALERAFLADDPQAIHDAGFNLATTQVRLRDFKASLETLQRVSHALSIRGWTEAQQADLHLIRAAVFYQQQHWQDSEAEAGYADHDRDADTQNEAHALIGLDASALGDRARLEEEIRQLAASKDERDQTNVRELLIHRQLMDHQWQQAVDEAQKLEKMREEASDYEAMRRALLLQAQALKGMGHIDEAQAVMQREQDSLNVSPNL